MLRAHLNGLFCPALHDDTARRALSD